MRKILESHREFIHQRVYEARQTDEEIDKLLDVVTKSYSGNVIKSLIELAEKK